MKPCRRNRNSHNQFPAPHAGRVVLCVGNFPTRSPVPLPLHRETRDPGKRTSGIWQGKRFLEIILLCPAGAETGEQPTALTTPGQAELWREEGRPSCRSGVGEGFGDGGGEVGGGGFRSGGRLGCTELELQKLVTQTGRQCWRAECEAKCYLTC